jgi:crotonobetainyl-CoA:carnitine CoA-transferase CaiB-like acyl-CoA transferase
VTPDEEWARLPGLLAQPSREASLSLAERADRREELDNVITAWAEGGDAPEVIPTLQQAGISAAPVLDVQGLLVDRHTSSARRRGLDSRTRLGRTDRQCSQASRFYGRRDR